MKRKTCIFKNVAMLFIAIGLLAVFVGCNDKNDEVGPLRQEVQALRSDLTKSFEGKVDAKSKELQDQLNQAKKEIADLSKRREGMSPEQLQAKIDAATANLITTASAQAMYDKYVENVKAQLANAVTAEQLEALRKDVEGLDSKVGNLKAGLDDLSTEVGTINHKIAALETLVGDNKKDLDTALAKLKEDIKTQLAGKFTEFTQSLDSEVQKLNQKIADQKTELVKMMKEYKDANAELIKANERLAKANKSEIATLKSDVAALKTKVTKLDEDFRKAQAELVNVVSRILNSRLTSLVLLPDYVSDQGGALPVISFSPLQTEAECAKFLAPSVEVKYIVNPSTVKASDIDTQNLRFRYNDPMVSSRSRQELVAPKAEFVSLQNGILTVKASVNVKETWAANPRANTKNRIDQLMLEVPVKGEDAVVSSDWAKIDYSARTAEIVKTPRKATSHSWSKYVLAPTVQKAKDLNVDHETVIEMAWDKTVDMNRVVKSMYSSLRNNDDFDPAKYGLEFAFDLKDEQSRREIVYNLGGNNTNQQEFISLNGSEVSTRVYGKDANRAAIGRTPIVHVMLKSGDCIVKEGFVKFSIVETEIPAVPPITFEPANKTYKAVCGANQVVHKIGTKEMNEEFYHAVNMSKEDFHAKYKFENVDEGVGTIVEKPDPTDKTSFNLEYTLTEEEVWENAGKEAVWKKAKYTYGSSVIEMTFKVKIIKPAVTLDVLLDNYWYNNSALEKSGQSGVKNTIVQNVAVPQSANDSDPSHATYENNINNAFKSVNNLLDVRGLGRNYRDYTYEYIFDKDNQPVRGTYVSDDGKQLMYRNQVIATIKRTADGDMIEYGTSDRAKELLNKGPQYSRAKVILVVKNSCGKELGVTVKGLEEKDRFNVIFLRPINVEGVSTKHFVDGVDFTTAGSYIDIKEIAELSDWRNFVTKTKKYDFLPSHENYYAYYDVKNIKVDIDNIRTEGLTVGGRAITTVPATVEIKQTENNEVVGSKTYKYGRLTYRNNGNNLGQEFWLVLPVTVEYKWGEIVNTNVKVKVASTKNARKRVK